MAMRAAILAEPAIQAIDGAGLTALCEAIASTVVAHITSFAVIPPGIPVATDGGPAAQTGATTGPGTVT